LAVAVAVPSSLPPSRKVGRSRPAYKIFDDYDDESGGGGGCGEDVEFELVHHTGSSGGSGVSSGGGLWLDEIAHNRSQGKGEVMTGEVVTSETVVTKVERIGRGPKNSVPLTTAPWVVDDLEESDDEEDVGNDGANSSSNNKNNVVGSRSCDGRSDLLTTDVEIGIDGSSRRHGGYGFSGGVVVGGAPGEAVSDSNEEQKQEPTAPLRAPLLQPPMHGNKGGFPVNICLRIFLLRKDKRVG
jgi:hypothetical protein